MHNKTVQGVVEYAKTYVAFGRCETGTIGLRFCFGGVCVHCVFVVPLMEMVTWRAFSLSVADC